MLPVSYNAFDLAHQSLDYYYQMVPTQQPAWVAVRINRQSPLMQGADGCEVELPGVRQKACRRAGAVWGWSGLEEVKTTAVHHPSLHISTILVLFGRFLWIFAWLWDTKSLGFGLTIQKMAKSYVYCLNPKENLVVVPTAK